MFVEQYLRPRSVEETLGLLTEYGDDAKLVAGGQSLMVLLHEGLVAPRVLIGLSAVSELAGITTDGEAMIGALATHTQVLSNPGIRSSWPVLAEAERAVSSVQIRNRGTLCGNLAHAYPTADPPTALLALDAALTLRSPRGTRQVPAGEFALGPLTTVLEPAELITAVTLPPPPAGARYAYLKYALRPLDFAIVGVAVRLAVDPEGRCRHVRIGLNGAASRPLRATEAERILEGAPAGTGLAQLLAAAADAAAGQSEPLGEVFESSAYRREMVRVYVRRALERALR
ncbi:MAG TPA: xanthine dehydrogenase family protein subunit M [Streptosporangiaceae bacterium]|nr:xanthine dehydrogenase family protein subunit M [Streptosporangiaceae bacterium]